MQWSSEVKAEAKNKLAKDFGSFSKHYYNTSKNSYLRCAEPYCQTEGASQNNHQSVILIFTFVSHKLFIDCEAVCAPARLLHTEATPP